MELAIGQIQVIVSLVLIQWIGSCSTFLQHGGWDLAIMQGEWKLEKTRSGNDEAIDTERSGFTWKIRGWVIEEQPAVLDTSNPNLWHKVESPT